MAPMILWPYDEVSLGTGADDSEVIVASPWLKIAVTISSGEQSRIQSLIRRFSTQSLDASDLQDLNWFFGSLAKYPLCYVLPRQDWSEAQEVFSLKDSSLLNTSAQTFLKSALKAGHSNEVSRVSEHPLFRSDWKWDAEGAIQFARSPEGIDPKAFFTVTRRFHLLSCVENDATESLFEYARSFRSDSAKFERASALMVRQNHYVTERCRAALEPSLQIAQGARDQVQHFIDAEYGHDRLLKAAMVSMGQDPESIPVTSEAKVLMDLLQYSAERNFLAFAMNVDFFERSAYQASDPLAKLLEQGGLTKAAGHINRHMDINDSGGHENVAMNFLATMGPIQKEYAEEALRLAEATSNVMNLISSGVREILD